MAAIKFSKQYIEPNPNEIDYWVDLSSNQYGGRMKYYNGFEWVDLVNPDGTHIDINDFYNKLQINQMLSQKASVDSVESKVDDDEVSDVIKNISFSQRGEDGVEMVMFKYDDTTVGIQLPIADNTKSGIITKDTFKNLVNQTQLQQLYSEMYTKLSEIRNNYQPKLRAGANIKIENNVISAVSKIGTDWNDIANKPDIYDKSQVDTMMSGVYKIKGSRRFEALPLYGNTVGDTYNITNDFSLHGEDYPIGTNVVWTENGWDALAGIFDTSELEEDIQEVRDNSLTVVGQLDVLSEKTFKANVIFAPFSSTGTFSMIFKPLNKEAMYLTCSNGELKYGGATSLSKIWHEGNDGEGSGLDADLLDGKHLNMFMYYDTNNDNLSDSTKGNKIIRLTGSAESDVPYGYGDILQWTGRPLNDTDYNNDGNFYHQLYSTSNNGLYYRSKFSSYSWKPWKTIAFTDSNVASATKLATPIKLWGNDFDGSSDINGSLKLLNNTTISWNNSSGEQVDCLKLNDYDNLVIGEGVTDSKKLTIIDGYKIFMRYSNYRFNGFLLNESGNVGIGTDNPQYKLDVNGQSRINDNLYINGILHINNINSIAYDDNLVIGYGFATNEKNTIIDGNKLIFRYNTNHSAGLILNLHGNITIGGSDFASTNHKLYVNGPLKINGVASFKYAMSLANDSHDFIRLSSGGDTDEYAYLLARNVVTGNNNGKLAITGYNAYKLNVALIKASNTNITGSLDVQDQITSGDLVDWYGVSWSEDSSNPTCTRIGNMALHRSLPIQSAMKGYYIGNHQSACPECMLPLNDNWSKLHYDINNNDEVTVTSFVFGNIVVKIPEFWYIDEYDGATKTHNLKISQTAKAGWCHHKEAYVGAYEGYDDGSHYRSIKDYTPTVSVNRGTIRTKARANGYEDEYKWNIYTYEEHRAICHLFLVEYATRNSQAPVNTALTADGFKQGGLGSGCTTGTVKINGVDTYSFIPTGTTDSLGNGSGQVAYTVTQTDADGNEISTVTRYANRYRGIENPFGHIWKHVDDVVNVYNAETTYKTVYKCNKPEHFATNKNAKYKSLCSFPGGSKMTGYSKEIKATINCDFFKYSVGGSESTYWCDYNYDNDDTTEHCLLIGGSSGNGGRAGLFYFYLSSGVGHSSVGIGSRLTYLPWAE